MKIFNFERQDSRDIERKYGVIKTSITQYITPTMIFVLLMCGALTFLNFEQLYINYKTNIPLNSVIMIVFVMAMTEAFNNNLNIFNTARFFKKMEGQINEPIVNEDVILKLKKMLETSAYLINTQNTFKLLSNLQKYGHPLITDNDARLIKSKLGFRIRIQRGSVSFMGGILVMLGLIGTFWGLLLTIGSVSEAMDVIAEQAENLGSAEGSGIGNIIKSISAPLQGMGLAFSSSLFGLAGSLVVGFFNYACTQAQDKAIEDFSRWIDENIPTVGSEEEKFLKLEQGLEAKDTKKSNEKEEKASKSSVQDVIKAPEFLNEDITTQILFTLQQSTIAQNQLSDNFDKLLSAQSTIQELLVAQNEHFSVLNETNATTNEKLNNINELVKQDIENNIEIKRLSEKNVNQNEKINTQLLSECQTLETGLGSLHESLRALEDAVGSSNSYFADMKSIVQQNKELQDELLNEAHQIKHKILQNEHEALHKICDKIANNIQAMDKSLHGNIRIMKEVVKEGNIDRMARVLKEMQVFWLQMKQNAFDVVKKEPTDK